MPYTFERSPDTDAVIEILRSCNDRITYDDLAARSNLPVDRAKSLLHTARNALRKDGILFGTIRSEGLHRLTDHDKVRKPEAFKKRVRRGAGRELKDLSTISAYDQLSKVEQHSVTLNRTILHAMRQSAAVKPEPTPTTRAPLPDAATLIQQRK